jgi:hypothetical protein
MVAAFAAISVILSATAVHLVIRQLATARANRPDATIDWPG